MSKRHFSTGTSTPKFMFNNLKSLSKATISFASYARVYMASNKLHGCGTSELIHFSPKTASNAVFQISASIISIHLMELLLLEYGLMTSSLWQRQTISKTSRSHCKTDYTLYKGDSEFEIATWIKWGSIWSMRCRLG